MVAIRIYVEGGGNVRREQAPLREGFRRLFERLLGNTRGKLQVTACGGRKAAFDEFKKALRSNRDALCILLVDSEAPVPDGTSVWQHVGARQGDKWVKPDGVSDEQLYLMVQCMEAWLVADRAALKSYYGDEFNEGALPAASNVEAVPKKDLYDKLEAATRQAKKTKGKYTESHAFELIAMVDPAKVRKASPHAERFFSFLEGKCGA
jgi:hypothetical protein